LKSRSNDHKPKNRLEQALSVLSGAKAIFKTRAHPEASVNSKIQKWESCQERVEFLHENFRIDKSNAEHMKPVTMLINLHKRMRSLEENLGRLVSAQQSSTDKGTTLNHPAISTIALQKVPFQIA
jgi:hypothetical protein